MEKLSVHVADAVFIDPSVPKQALGELLYTSPLTGSRTRSTDIVKSFQILRISAVTSRTDGIIDENECKFVEPQNFDIQYRLQPGDLLSCRYNGSLHFVGRFGLYCGKLSVPHIYPDKLIRFRVDASKIVPSFARIVLNATQIRRVIESLATTTAGNFGITIRSLVSISVPVPSLEEQHRIVNEYDTLQAKVAALKSMQAKMQVELSGLQSKLLDEVFGSHTANHSADH